MIEAYSQNVAVLTNGVIPFNSVSLRKGNTAVLSGVSSIQLNRKGIYKVDFEMIATATAAGDIVVEMTKNGTVQTQTVRTITGATTATSVTVPVSTLVQVSEDNTCCCDTAPTVIQFLNTGVGITANNIDIVVTKIC